jgi:hypothetical protein
MDVQIEPLAGPLPSVAWRWDPETDILTGSFKGNRKATGLTGTIELTDAEGSVAVLDVHNGMICGLDVVVWPEVTTSERLALPGAATEGRVVLPTRTSRPGTAALEVDTSLTVETNPAETLFHLRIGPRRGAQLVRVADRFYVEVDEQRALAGFWMADVPPFSQFEEG